MSESDLPVFSSRSIIVSGLTFRSLIHFVFIFVYGVRKCSLHSFTNGWPVFPAPLVKDVVLSCVLHSPPSPSSRGSLVALCFLALEWYHLHNWECWCFSCLCWFQFVNHPAHLMMCYVYGLSKHTNSRQPCSTTSSILNQTIFPCRVLNISSQATYRFISGGKMVWYPISLRGFHSLLWSTQRVQCSCRWWKTGGFVCVCVCMWLPIVF